ncbi:hypothetical protein ALC62_00952 [Cyphomyrmex costatus]|uniref:Uncharacterized protein n=1 Tax=Cyphomyrmex costatus TaxID=456900 RepID=A0A195D5F1_9HYME|nr:hypothetical protein ALC62_00952 [Cyphomyrmex costatus]
MHSPKIDRRFNEFSLNPPKTSYRSLQNTSKKEPHLFLCYSQDGRYKVYIYEDVIVGVMFRARGICYICCNKEVTN